MDCFIKKIFSGRADEKAHQQFVRFGKGDYKGRAALSLHVTGRIKLGGSFEYANDFVLFVAENCSANFSGIILSEEQLGLSNEKKKSGIFHYKGNFSSEEIKRIFDRAYCLLLDAECSGLSLKTKKKLPKPGKLKIDDKFCVIKCDLKYLPAIKQAFFWDVPECKKVKVQHEYQITDLVYPKLQKSLISESCQNSERILKNEKDFEKIRILTKRKGKIIRKLEIDGQERKVEKDFEA